MLISPSHNRGLTVYMCLPHREAVTQPVSQIYILDAINLCLKILYNVKLAKYLIKITPCTRESVRRFSNRAERDS